MDTHCVHTCMDTDNPHHNRVTLLGPGNVARKLDLVATCVYGESASTGVNVSARCFDAIYNTHCFNTNLSTVCQDSGWPRRARLLVFMRRLQAVAYAERRCWRS